MKNYIIVTFLITNFFFCGAQDFAITRVELGEGGVVNLFYDLKDTVASRRYTVEVFSSTDNYISRLEKVGGDMGLEVKPGLNHKIVWRAKEELGADFDGKIGLEVRGRIYIPFVRLEGMHRTYKRGKEYPITWTGGTQQNILNFDLYQGDEKVFPFSNIANVGHTSITIPTSVKPGKNYHYKVTDSRNKDQIVNSKPFSIKRKMPLLLKTLPIVVVGGLVAVVTGGNKPAATIPDPADPGSIH